MPCLFLFGEKNFWYANARAGTVAEVSDGDWNPFHPTLPPRVKYIGIQQIVTGRRLFGAKSTVIQSSDKPAVGGIWTIPITHSTSIYLTRTSPIR